MRIRSLLEGDLPLVRRWMRDTPEAPAWSDDDLARIANAPSAGERRIRRGWVAEEESQSAMAGFVVANALSIPGAPAECELEFVFVATQARGQGIGRTLVRAVLEWATDLGAEEIRLELRASNIRALRLYQQCGFTMAGNRPRYYPGYYLDPPEDAVLMRCRIGHGHGDAPV
jgi:[ribosomal protein S18]-alanine N-acetyltransferase